MCVPHSGRQTRGTGGDVVPLEAEWTDTSLIRGTCNLIKQTQGWMLEIWKSIGKKRGCGWESCSVTKISSYFLVNNSSRISSRVFAVPRGGKKQARQKMEIFEKMMLFTLGPPQVPQNVNLLLICVEKRAGVGLSHFL